MQYRLPTNRGGMLSQQRYKLPFNLGNTPILNPSPTVRPPQQQPVLQQNGATGNRRMSSRIPNQQIDMASEGNILMGGAVLGAASEGALPALAAGAQMYGNIMDYNRQGKMAEYEQQMLRANEEEARRQLALKMQQDAAKAAQKDAPDPADVVAAQNQIENMETMLAELAKGGLTGLFDGTGQRWLDRLGLADWWTGTDEGSKREYIRKMLQEFKVDQTLTKTANTKGAISNQEMNLFMSPFPSISLDNEKVWIKAINERLEIARKILASVQGDTTGSSSNQEVTFDPVTGKFSDE